MHLKVFLSWRFKLISFLAFSFAFQAKAQNCQLNPSANTVCSGGVVTISASNNAIIERSLDFDGVNDCIEVSNAAKYNFGTNQDFTVEFWIKTTQNMAADRWIVTKSGYSYNPRWQIGIRSGKVRISLGDGSNSIIASGNANVSNNQWHHIAAVFDRSSNVTVYVDGAFDFNQAISSVGNISSAVNLGIGASSTPIGFVNYYDGLLDEVRIWNSTITQADIIARMNDMINPALYPNLIGYYDFNEGVGTTVFDCAANPRNGNIFGASFNLASTVTPFVFHPTWNTGDTTLSITLAVFSDTTLSITSGWCKYECTDSTTIYVGSGSNNFLQDSLVICGSSAVWIKPTVQTDSIVWSTGSLADSIQVSQSGLYWALAKINGCFSFDTIWIINVPALSGISNSYSICPGSSYTVQIPVVANQQVVWFDGSSALSRTFSAAGNYWVTRTTPCDTLTDTITIIESGQVFTPVSQTYTICDGEDVTIQLPVVPNQVISWFDGSSALMRSFSTAGNFWVTRTAPCDTLTDTIKVTVIPCDTLPPDTDTTSRIFIPNVFTPNNDGINDLFAIQGVGIFQYNLYIFNRWGTALFQSNAIETWWDGTYRNEPVADGVYVYLITYRDVRGKYRELQGYVTVLR
jgi:gliding motility-associated-like protein